jgi:tight adherence protein C
MMNFNWVELGLMVFLVTAGLGLVGWGLKYFDTSEVNKRIQTFILAPHLASLPANLSELRGENYSESFLQRTLVAWLNALMSNLGRLTPAQSVQELNRRLLVAGNPYNLRAQQFYGLRLLFMLVGLALGFFIYQLNPRSSTNLLLGLAVFLISAVAPGLWLGVRIRNRQDAIRRNLPDALDMLSVCAAAGLSFDQSLLRVGQTFKTTIGQEFARVVAEMEVGVSRQQALRNLQVRVDLAELSSFVAMIVQSEVLGMSISDVLHAQAEQMRIQRQHRAKEAAQRLPAKMMIPLVFFIFPALLAVLLGPSIPEIMGLLR